MSMQVPSGPALPQCRVCITINTIFLQCNVDQCMYWPLKLWFIQGSRPSVDYLLEKFDSCIDNLESCLYEFMELV